VLLFPSLRICIAKLCAFQDFFHCVIKLKLLCKIFPKHLQLIRNLVKQTALLFTGIIIKSFSKAHSPSLFRSICNFSLCLMSIIFLYNIQSSAKSLSVDSLLYQISIMYAKNSSGPSTLPCGTPDVTLTSSNSPPL
jgi:hypothetical protein